MTDAYAAYATKLPPSIIDEIKKHAGKASEKRTNAILEAVYAEYRATQAEPGNSIYANATSTPSKAWPTSP